MSNKQTVAVAPMVRISDDSPNWAVPPETLLELVDKMTAKFDLACTVRGRA
jgi:hypothetical protein